MERIKKELPMAILIFLVGLCFITLTVWNAEQYDKTHPESKSSYYEYEISNQK